MNNLKRAVFMDRDGTLNEETGHLHRLEDWIWTPGALDAVKGFNNLGFLVIVVSNQAGIARGYYTIREVNCLHDRIQKTAAAAGARIDSFYYCPHHPQYGEVRNCSCRKPKPGLLLQAHYEHRIDLVRSFMIGDRVSDIQAGEAAGAKTILVKTGYGKSEQQKLPASQTTAENLYAAYEQIMAQLLHERND